MAASKTSKNPSLDPNEILVAEFNYASQTAFQANEDRVKIFSYFLATVGSMLAAVILFDFTDRLHVGMLGMLFGSLGFVGLMSLLKLIKLRLSWIESVKAMSVIKSFYVGHTKNLDLSEAFRWSQKTVPSADKGWTVAFLLAMTIMALSSLSVGLAGVFGGYFMMGELAWEVGLAASLVFFIFQTALWFRLIRN